MAKAELTNGECKEFSEPEGNFVIPSNGTSPALHVVLAYVVNVDGLPRSDQKVAGSCPIRQVIEKAILEGEADFAGDCLHCNNFVSGTVYLAE